MKQADAIALAKDASAHVPPGARERVWRRLGSAGRAAPTPVWAKALAFAACAAAGFGLVSSLLARGAPAVFTSETSIAVGDVTRTNDGVLHLASGQLLVSSWGAPRVRVVALRNQIEAEAALFSIDVAAQSVAVDVREGEVHVNGERVGAGRRWPSGIAVAKDFSPVVRLEPARAAEERTWALAEQALRAGNHSQALERFAALGGQGLRAEAALLRKGELQLRELSSPLDALSTFEEALQRFPSGSLTQELALSSIEATLTLEKWTEARRLAAAFLTRFPQNERLLEVRYVSALAAWQLNDRPAACAEARGLQTAAFSGARRATLEKLLAQCTLFER